MSCRVDVPLISGACVVGNTGLGVLADNIPLNGEHGGSIFANDISLPADSGKEIMGLITVAPASMTVTLAEDGSGTAAGSGQDSLTYQLYVDGVATGSPTVSTFSIGGLTIQPQGIASTAAVGSPTLGLNSTNQSITPAGIASTAAVGNPLVVLQGDQVIMPSGIASTSAVGTPTLKSDGWNVIVDESTTWTRID